MLEAKNIKKRYRALNVLKGVDLLVKQGEIISIVGASGAGKTTLLQILGTLDRTDDGSIQFKGTEVGKIREDRLVHAEWYKRLLNVVVDLGIIGLIAYSFYLISLIIFPVYTWSIDPENYNIWFVILGSLALSAFLYYFSLEATTSRTLGKLITGTRVITKNGQKPSKAQILSRTLSRLIPLEFFTFLSPKPQNGLHDGLSNTLVINNGMVNNTDGLAYDQLGEDGLSKFRNEQIGFVFQFHHLLPEFTALENVCIPAFIGGKSKSETEGRAKELLGFLGLSDRLQHRPNQLSGGEQQRVAVARALINNPAVIMADEPSGNLDSKSARELHQLFFDLRDRYNQTFIIVTHNEELANMADRRLVISDGAIAEDSANPAISNPA